MTVPEARETPLVIDGHTFDRDERWALHSALLAQVDDMHAGGVYTWEAREVEAAVRVLSRVTAESVGTDPQECPDGYGPSLSSRVAVIALIVPLYDLDHADMKPEEWVEAERLIGLMEGEFGR